VATISTDKIFYVFVNATSKDMVSGTTAICSIDKTTTQRRGSNVFIRFRKLPDELEIFLYPLLFV
jgi:hypothetical protein